MTPPDCWLVYEYSSSTSSSYLPASVPFGTLTAIGTSRGAVSVTAPSASVPVSTVSGESSASAVRRTLRAVVTISRVSAVPRSASPSLTTCSVTSFVRPGVTSGRAIATDRSGEPRTRPPVCACAAGSVGVAPVTSAGDESAGDAPAGAIPAATPTVPLVNISAAANAAKRVVRLTLRSSRGGRRPCGRAYRRRRERASSLHRPHQCRVSVPSIGSRRVASGR